MTSLWSASCGRQAFADLERLIPGGSDFIEHLGGIVDFRPLMAAWLFVASDGGYIRPHKDWTDRKPRFTRLHLPISSGDDCLSSEDNIVYRMNVGEVWYLDSGRTHSAICFGSKPRIHLILDYPPDCEPHALLDPACHVDRPPIPLPRPGFDSRERTAIAGLSRLIGPATFERVVALLGSLHFRRDADAADMYDWLDAICRDSGSAELICRSTQLRQDSIGGAIGT